MKALIGLLLLVFGHGVSSVLHSLHYFYTASSGLSTFPEFVAVGMVDGVQMLHYDSVSKRAVPKQDWMERYTRDHSEVLERDNGNLQGAQQVFKANIGTVKQRFNQTGGTHMVQWISTFVYGKSTLQRTERPRVSLLQRSPSSPVVCHATGFYPDRVVVFWRRDGQELHEQVDPGEVLPNHDGTFQVSVDLNLKAAPQEDWGRYECVVQLRGIEDISTPLDPALIRTNSEDQSGLTIPIIIGLLVLLLAAAVVGVLLYKKRNASDQRHKPVGSDTSSENTEGQNPAPEAQPLTTG
ncbi:unnamed protein product [Boreogadus saida]